MKNEEAVLIGVLKDKRDLEVLLKKKQYRMPVMHAPKKKAQFIAFYQPSSFTGNASRICYYAQVTGRRILKRIRILPHEKDHPAANEDYYLINLGPAKSLKRPVLNKIGMRISFGFTTQEKLLSAENIGELFDVMPTEEILFRALCARGIRASRQHGFSLADGKRYRMDFAVFCRKGPLNIECDGEKWHSIKVQRLKDAQRDSSLKKEGWTILRLDDARIAEDIKACLLSIEDSIKKLGGTIK